jgi:hypothetical protein
MNKHPTHLSEMVAVGDHDGLKCPNIEKDTSVRIINKI